MNALALFRPARAGHHRLPFDFDRESIALFAQRHRERAEAAPSKRHQPPPPRLPARAWYATVGDD